MELELDQGFFVADDAVVMSELVERNHLNCCNRLNLFDWIHQPQQHAVSEMLDCGGRLTEAAVAYMQQTWYYMPPWKQSQGQGSAEVILVPYQTYLLGYHSHLGFYNQPKNAKDPYAIDINPVEKLIKTSIEIEQFLMFYLYEDTNIFTESTWIDPCVGHHINAIGKIILLNSPQTCILIYFITEMHILLPCLVCVVANKRTIAVLGGVHTKMKFNLIG